ncbi:alpha/beta hydrolase [Microbacterium excoecariae]|uniref:alpha/beta hydrolase n=1 Tax=Microbacterium excoecariae TaxID=2715210 RepID=UPI00140BC820|nr:hypothetical protein [Microbacterium excoecariae]
MNTAILLDGWQHRRAPLHWQGWLAERLVEHGWRVDYLTLPDPESPRYDAWSRVVRDAVGRADRPVVVAHGLSVLLWLRMCVDATAAQPRVERALLVAPPAAGAHGGDVSAFWPAPEDAATVVAAHERRPDLVWADDDPYLPGGASDLARRAGARSIPLRGGAHLNAAAGFGPWPEALSWCLTGIWTAAPDNDEGRRA